MLKIDVEPEIGTIMEVHTSAGYIRWYRVCAICADLEEIVAPTDPLHIPAMCPVCIEEVAELKVARARRGLPEVTP